MEVKSIRLLIPPQSSKSFLRLPPAGWEDFSIKLQPKTFTCSPLFPLDKKSSNVEVNMNWKPIKLYIDMDIGYCNNFISLSALPAVHNWDHLQKVPSLKGNLQRLQDVGLRF